MAMGFVTKKHIDGKHNVRRADKAQEGVLDRNEAVQSIANHTAELSVSDHVGLDSDSSTPAGRKAVSTLPESSSGIENSSMGLRASYGRQFRAFSP